MFYAEKIMISRQDQLSPMHRHIVKAEDIINRGGGTLVLKLFNSDAAGAIDKRPSVTVATDGVLPHPAAPAACCSSIRARA